MPTLRRLPPLLAVAGVTAALAPGAGCGTNDVVAEGRDGIRDARGDGEDAGVTGPIRGADPLPGNPSQDAGVPGPAVRLDGGGEMVCAKQRQGAMLEPVYLLFAFDVSGSMGKGDKAWHDRALKWDPVVSATRAFFENDASEGLSASLTFFPADGGEDTRCEPESYMDADVPMTGLPSAAFGQAMDAVGEEDWRGGTPTLYVLQGLFAQIEALRAAESGRYVVVLVTDGYPQDCDENSIDLVAELVAEHAAEVPTYVIGVENPPLDDAPDTTTNLAAIAEAGGTERAYLIDTGDPERTVARFTETIDTIRGASVACEAAIPPPPAGRTFDKTRVSVSVTLDGEMRELGYDSSCGADAAWHYDDRDDPTEIVLCPSACEALQGASEPELDVTFECEQVILGPL